MKASLTTLGETETVYPATVSLLPPNRIQVAGIPHLAFGTAVKIRQGQQLWLGEIVEYSANGDAVAKVLHSLTSVDDLARLADRFMGRQGAETPTLS